MADIIHELVIKGSPTEVFTAINSSDGLKNWWVDDALTDGTIDGRAIFHFHAAGVIFNMKITEVEINKTLVWLCSGEPEEWVGTQISFKLEKHDQGTILKFNHSGWLSTSGDYGMCNYHWGLYLKSLKSYIEEGIGSPTKN